MLIGRPSNKPKLETIRRIKRALNDTLDLPEGAMVTVAELACLEEDCAPIETVIGLLREGAPQLQHKVHKATEAVGADDLVQICKAWGIDVPVAAFEQFFSKEE